MAESKRASRRVLKRDQICEGLSFAASEAYKLLRTNLLFSLPKKKCHIIGITSSVRGEGKSTTSVNLAYTIAQSGKRVLLIDGDMRLPSVASKLELKSAPGLSNLIAGLRSEASCMRKSSQMDNWYILPAGDIPPNPSELLGSERMHSLLQHYEDIFDVIVLDLPPVNIVSDALIVSQWADGLVCVVRQNYTDRRALQDCMYQIEKLGSHFLGFVMTDAQVGETGYKSYGKYGKYGKKYGYGYGYDYGYGYGNSADKSKATDAKQKAFLDATTEEVAIAEAEEEKTEKPE